MIQLSHFCAYTWRKPSFKKIHAPNAHCSATSQSQDMETKPIDRGMDNEDMVHVYKEALLSH